MTYSEPLYNLELPEEYKLRAGGGAVIEKPFTPEERVVLFANAETQEAYERQIEAVALLGPGVAPKGTPLRISRIDYVTKTVTFAPADRGSHADRL